MPGENFRWRMLGAALYMAGHIPSLDQYDGVIVTSLFNLADFKALIGPSCPPVMVYFHENQLTYPQPKGDRSAFMLGMINITTALVADQVVFNSNTHREAFLSAVPEFLNRGKDFRPEGITDKIRSKSFVLYPGITLPRQEKVVARTQNSPPLIIWNHRWGFDKNHRLFFSVLEELNAQGLDFQVALMGENFSKIPEEFVRAREILKDRIVAFGYVASREDYIRWLKKGTVVVSTAIQENFGMSVIEAVIMGCFPLLPNRLSYPEILPAEFHAHCLYKNRNDLLEKLSRIITDVQGFSGIQTRLSERMASFLWENMIPAYDITLESLGSG
ncbi:MAG: DUF3524 domain-containing protein [Desulfobacteraceae bacterium]|nr:MAG: DUF3524 domain-containing protein [Desulfobacteraceae bacterium]